MAKRRPEAYTFHAMFRRIVLITSSVLLLAVLGLWVERNVRSVSLDNLKVVVDECRREFDRIDNEVYAASHAERDGPIGPGPFRLMQEIMADLDHARSALDAAYIRRADALAHYQATGKKNFAYPLHFDFSRYSVRWCVLHISDEAVTMTFNSADSVPLRAKWRSEKEARAMMIGQFESRLGSAFVGNSTVPYREDIVAQRRAGARAEFAEKLRQLLEDEGFFFNYNSAPTRELILQVPFWMLIWLFAAYPIITLVGGRIRERIRLKRGQCPRCAYDLTGNVSGVSPECGKKVGRQTQRPELSAD